MRKEYYKVFNQNVPQLLQLKTNGIFCHFHVLHAEKENYTRENTLSPKDLNKAIHSHPVYHLILYTGGQNVFFLDGNLHPSCRGVLAVSSPGVPHFFGACKAGNVQSIELTFGLEDIEIQDKYYSLPFHKLLSVISGISLQNVSFPVSFEETPFQELYFAFNELMEVLAQTYYSGKWIDVELCIIKVINFLVRQVYLANPLAEKHNENILQNTKAFIEKNFNRPLQLDTLVKKTPFSPRHFSRLFKERFGQSPISYQHFLRLNTAKMLLNSSNDRINEIAEQVGYKDVYQFSKIFKKHFKVSPSRMRSKKTFANRS